MYIPTWCRYLFEEAFICIEFHMIYQQHVYCVSSLRLVTLYTAGLCLVLLTGVLHSEHAHFSQTMKKCGWGFTVKIFFYPLNLIEKHVAYATDIYTT